MYVEFCQVPFLPQLLGSCDFSLFACDAGGYLNVEPALCPWDERSVVLVEGDIYVVLNSVARI